MSKFDVEWGSCLNAYYPWVHILHTKICILKNEADREFLACFCSTDDKGNISNRGFCITKVECLMNGQGINVENASELEVEETCLSNIQYFLEANTNDKSWFSKAQKNDKLRVRAPYHKDSPCFNENFSGLFDIGQLEFVDLTNGRMDVLTPLLVSDSKNVLKKKVEDVGVDVTVENVDIPVTRERMDKLSFFFEERILANFLIWIPGIILVYSTMLKEKGKMLNIFVYFLQFVIITFGLYHATVPFLPESWYDVLSHFRKVQFQLVVGLFFLAPVLCSDSCEMTEYFLKISLFSFIPDIAMWKVLNVMYTEERFENYKIFIRVWFFVLSHCSLYKIILYLNKTYLTTTNIPVELKRSNSRKKKETKKVVKPANTEAVAPAKLPLEKKRSNKGKKQKEEIIFSILCQYQCEGKLNIGYVSVNCTETCFNQFHLQCWSSYLNTKVKQPETSLLGQACLTHSCNGRIFEIVWVDKYGKETARKDNYADLATVKKEVKQKDRSKTKTALTRSYSDTSGSGVSSEDKSLALSASPAAQTRQSNSTEAKMTLINSQLIKKDVTRSLSTSYASMVKNNKNNNNSPESASSVDVVHQILELNCPEYFNQNCQLTEKSKILSLINKSKEQERPAANGKYSNSSAIIFVPGVPSAISSSSSSPSAASSASCSPTTIQSTLDCDKPGKIELKKPKSVDLDPALESRVSSFTKMMGKHFPDFSLLDVDEAVKKVLASVRLEDVTIPEFREMIGEKLEKSSVICGSLSDTEIYMSDDDDDDYDGDCDEEDGIEAEECPICTELLKQETYVLQPCGHVFHLNCIREWLAKDLSCPKCRAVVKKFNK